MPELIKYQNYSSIHLSSINFYVKDQFYFGPLDSDGSIILDNEFLKSDEKYFLTKLSERKETIEGHNLFLQSPENAERTGIKILYRVEITKEQAERLRQACEDLVNAQPKFKEAVKNLESMIKLSCK